MKRLLAAAALAAALSCSAAGTQDIQKHGEEYFRIFSILPDGQGILARRCTKLTQSGLCVGAPVLLPADAVKAPAEEKVVRLADPKMELDLGAVAKGYIADRVAQSLPLLLENTYSIAQIGAIVGFSSGGRFSKAFSKRMACTPGQYLRAHRSLL